MKVKFFKILKIIVFQTSNLQTWSMSFLKQAFFTPTTPQKCPLPSAELSELNSIHPANKETSLFSFKLCWSIIRHRHIIHTPQTERERAASEDDCCAVVPKRSPLCLHTEITVQSCRSFAWSSTARRSSPPSGLQIRLNRADFVDPRGRRLARDILHWDVSSTIYLFYRFFNVSKYIIPAIVRPNELVDVINHFPFWCGCGDGELFFRGLKFAELLWFG